MAPSRVDRSPRDRDDRARDDRPRHRRERAAYRFVEVRAAAGPARLDGLVAAGGAFLAGTVLGFLVLLGLGLVGGELVSGVRYEAEEVLRSTLGWWVLTLAVAVPVFVSVHAAATLAVTRALLAEGRPRTDVPPYSVRKRVAESSPAGALAGIAWTYLVLALLAGAVGLFAMDHDDAERTPAVAVSAVVGVVTAVGLLLLPGLRARWSAWQDVCARHGDGTRCASPRRRSGGGARRSARPHPREPTGGSRSGTTRWPPCWAAPAWSASSCS